MRTSWFALAGLLASGFLALAQQDTPPAASLDPAKNKLDDILLKWEKSMGSVQSLQAQLTRTAIDKTYQTTEVFEGSARFLKSTQASQPSRASLELYKKGKPEIFEKYLCTGTFLYEYAPGDKVIRIHELPPPKPGQLADDNFLSFMFGMKAAEAKTRYKITYVPTPAQEKWYYYLAIHPVLAADKADFSESRLVLSAANFTPRQLWFRQPNGNEVTWDFPKINLPADLKATDFGHPTLPPGWQFVRVPKQTEARVIRQAGSP